MKKENILEKTSRELSNWVIFSKNKFTLIFTMSTIIVTTAGIVYFIANKPFLQDLIFLLEKNSSAFIFIFIGTISAIILMIYLQAGIGSRSDSSSSRRLDRNLLNVEKSFVSLRLENARFVEQFEYLSQRVKQNSEDIKSSQQGSESLGLDKDQSQNLVDSIVSEIHGKASKKVLANLRKDFLAAYDEEKLTEEAVLRFDLTSSRLNNELYALSKRGNLNLVLGISTTITGLAILGFFVTSLTPTSLSAANFLSHTIPRISLVAFIELFAYFFLRLYKASLAEIKYFQNEITNIESKAVALITSIRLKKSNSISDVIQKIALTERNRTLEAGQSTTELESAKIENETLIKIIREFSSTIKMNKKSSD